MKSVLRILPLSLLLITTVGCSSDITRFDYPSLGINEGAGPQRNYSPTSAVQPKPIVPVQRQDYSAAPRRYEQTANNNYSVPSPYQRNNQAPQQLNPYNQQNDRAAYNVPPQRSNLPRLNQQPNNRYLSNQKVATQTPAEEQQYYSRQNVNQSAPIQGPLQAGSRYQVQAGDTLYSIARRNQVTVAELVIANNLQGNSIKLGQVLVIPGKGQQTNAPLNQQTARHSAVKSRPQTYTVAAGDSLYGIARRYGVKPGDLAVVNNISDPNSLKFGQVLKIPAEGGPVIAAQQKNNVQSRTEPKKPVRVASLDKKIPGLNKSNPRLTQSQTTRQVNLARPVMPKSKTGQNQFIWPVQGQIISSFGKQRSGEQNDGINLAVPTGTAVKAAESGVVAYSGNELKGYGNLILVRHENNWVSAYAHNSKLLVKRGDRVERGQMIAKAGNTGSVHQPQLHFELRRGAKPVDPRKYLSMR